MEKTQLFKTVTHSFSLWNPWHTTILTDITHTPWHTNWYHSQIHTMSSIINSFVYAIKSLRPPCDRFENLWFSINCLVEILCTVLAWMSAPFEINNFTTSKWPESAAQWRGVWNQTIISLPKRKKKTTSNMSK